MVETKCFISEPTVPRSNTTHGVLPGRLNVSASLSVQNLQNSQVTDPKAHTCPWFTFLLSQNNESLW